MNRISRSLIAIGIGTFAFTTMSKGAIGNWDIARIRDNVIYFRNGQKLNTGLQNARYIGQISLGGQSPLLIFSGEDCVDCCTPPAVFLFSPAEAQKKILPEYAPYDYPGREFSDTDSSLLYESRMFYGQVLPDVENGIIWYQTMLTELGDYQQSVYLLRVVNNKIYEELLLEDMPSLDDTLRLLKTGKCKEVKGADFVSER